MNKRLFLWGALILGMALVIVLIVRSLDEAEPDTSKNIDPGPEDIFRITEDDWTKGNPDAEIVIIKYSDFQCPTCYNYAAMDNQLSEELGDEVLFIYRHFPLPGFQYSRLAARYAEAAGRQGEFWKMHDMIFGNQPRWSQGNAESLFQDMAEYIGLDMQQLDKDLKDPAIEQRITTHFNQGQKIGIQGVPAIYINGQKVPIVRSMEEYKAQILSFKDK